MNGETKKYLKLLLERINVLRDKIVTRNADKETFNIFTCLRKYNDEVKLHSRFISSLIDPHGYHGLGFAPFNFLIQVLQSSFKYNPATVKVTPNSHDWAEHRDIDILIKDNSTRNAIIIENKIDAQDSNHKNEGQLEKYYREIIEENIPRESIEVYYLSIDGHDPSDESVNTSGKFPELKDKVRSISYGSEITNWLKYCIREAALKPAIRETLVQYLKLIEDMTNNDTETQDIFEIIDIVSKNEDSLKSSKLLIDNFKHIKWFTIYNFCNELSDEIKNRGYKDVTYIDPAIIDNIVHKGTATSNKQQLLFHFTDSNGIAKMIEIERWWEPYFGIRKEDNKGLPNDIGDKITEKAVRASLYDDKYKSDNWFYCSRFNIREDHKIDIWDFSKDGTFRIINTENRKDTIKEYLDYMESCFNALDIASLLN